MITSPGARPPSRPRMSWWRTARTLVSDGRWGRNGPEDSRSAWRFGGTGAPPDQMSHGSNRILTSPTPTDPPSRDMGGSFLWGTGWSTWAWAYFRPRPAGAG